MAPALAVLFHSTDTTVEVPGMFPQGPCLVTHLGAQRQQQRAGRRVVGQARQKILLDVFYCRTIPSGAKGHPSLTQICGGEGCSQHLRHFFLVPSSISGTSISIFPELWWRAGLPCSSTEGNCSLLRAQLVPSPPKTHSVPYLGKDQREVQTADGRELNSD